MYGDGVSDGYHFKKDIVIEGEKHAHRHKPAIISFIPFNAFSSFFISLSFFLSSSL